MKQLTIFYDNFCPNCSRFSKLVKKLDWIKLIKIKQLRNELDVNSIYGIDLELAKKQMASYNKEWHYGYNSLFYIFARLPLFWILMPFFYILKITTLGQLIYIELALKRKIIPIHCDAKNCNLS
jgi:predicted DCC family thiol-disulfide oxidoreductase YuxK